MDSPLRPAKQLLAAQGDEPLPEAPDLPFGGDLVFHRTYAIGYIYIYLSMLNYQGAMIMAGFVDGIFFG